MNDDMSERESEDLRQEYERQAIEEARRCLDTDGHQWAADFTPGDTCCCGAWYLLQREDGSWEIKPS